MALRNETCFKNRFFIAGEVFNKKRAEVSRNEVIYYYNFKSQGINFFLNSAVKVPDGRYIVSGYLYNNGRYPVLFAKDFTALHGHTDFNQVFLIGEVIKINYFEKRYTIVLKQQGYWRCICKNTYPVEVGDFVAVNGKFYGTQKSYKIIVDELSILKKVYVVESQKLKQLLRGGK